MAPLVTELFHIESDRAAHPAVSLSMPPGRKILCGGARVNWTGAGNLLTASYPTSIFQWNASAKDQGISDPSSITLWVIALNDPNDEWDVQIVQQTSGIAAHPTTTVAVPNGYVLTGGGAHTHWHTAGQLLTAMYPALDGRSWTAASKDHVYSDPGAVTAYAVVMQHRTGPQPRVDIYSQESQRAPHPSGSSGSGLPGTLVGGGARVSQGINGNLLTASYPQGDEWNSAAKDHLLSDPERITTYALKLSL